MKQPDRWERAIYRVAGTSNIDMSEQLFTGKELSTLLRQQHRAYVRMVKRHLFAVSVARDHPKKREQCLAILDELKNYAR